MPAANRHCSAVGVADVERAGGDQVEFGIGQAQRTADWIGCRTQIDGNTIGTLPERDAAAALGADRRRSEEAHAVGDESDGTAIRCGGDATRIVGENCDAGRSYTFDPRDLHVASTGGDRRVRCTDVNAIVIVSAACTAGPCTVTVPLPPAVTCAPVSTITPMLKVAVPDPLPDR